MTKLEELDYYIRKYPHISPILILKISVTKNGTVFTDKALARLQEKDYRFTKAEPFGIQLEIRKKDFYTPGAVMFRDGSSVLVNYGEPYADPFLVDYDEDNKEFLLTENGIVIDTVDFLPRPAFYDCATSRGTMMDHIGGTCTAQRLLVNGFQRCRFWENREQCHYCALFSADSVLEGEVNLDDIYETVHEMLKEPGRFTEISVSGGSDFGGDPPFSDEIARYIRVLNAVSRDFPGKMETQLQAPAYKKEDVKRIYDNTCLTSYRPNIEVWDKSSFERMCPGKTRWIGRDEWIRRMVDAVDVFGKGRVYTQMVCGAELAKPDGMKSVEQAIGSAIEGAEFFASNGISCHEEMWRPHRFEKLGWQEMQELDYFIRIADAFHEIRWNSGICTVETNYMRGSDNPDADLERADLAREIPVENHVGTARIKKEEYCVPLLQDDVLAAVREAGERCASARKAGKKSAADILPGAYLQTGADEMIRLDDITSADGRFIMIPLDTDRSLLSAYLVKCLWYKAPVTLWLVNGAYTLCLRASVYRHHIAGRMFRKMLDRVREGDPSADMAACAQLVLRSCGPADLPRMKVRDAGKRFAHRHLDRTGMK